jgi:hypothetical protein
MMKEIKTDLNLNSQATKNDDHKRRDHYNARAKLRAFVEVIKWLLFKMCKNTIKKK